MSSDQVQAYAAVAQTILAFATLVATVALSYMVYKGTRQIAISEYQRSINDAWVTIDTTILSDNALLDIADALQHRHKPLPTIDARKKRWVTYMMMNPLLASHRGIAQGLADKEAPDTLRAMLAYLVADDDLYAHTQTGVYGESFRALCEEIRAATARPPAQTS